MTEQTHTHTEAPASATAKMTSPHGVEWLLTVRDDTVNGLVTKVGKFEEFLLDHDWQPAAGRYSGAKPSTGSNGNGSTPNCPTHGTPMMDKGRGWFCPQKIAEDGGDGRPLYCKAKA